MSDRIKNAWNALRGKPSDQGRIDGVFNRIGSEAGLIPLFLDRTTEVRRKEIERILTELNNIEFVLEETKLKIMKEGKPTEESIQKIKRLEMDSNFQSYKLAKLFQLYFSTGDAHTRGLDGSLSNIVTAYVELYEDIGYLPSAGPTLRSASMKMLHLSWNEKDVDQAPPTFINTQPIIAPTQMHRVDLGAQTEGKKSTTPSARVENI